MTTKKQTEINRNPELLCPFFLGKINRALAMCAADGYPVRVFEGYRSPSRQDYLFEQGRSREGKIVTRARGWQSFHQYGLAVDVAFYVNNHWSWEGAFDKLVPIFRQCGLEWGGKGDGGHYQLTGGFTVYEAEQIMKTHGLIDLWNIIQSQKGI